MYTTCTGTKQQAWGKRVGSGLLKTVAAIVLAGIATSVLATDEQRRQAKRIHDRLTGVAPSEEVLDAMEAELANNGGASAALLAIGDTLYDLSLIHISEPTRPELVSRMPSSA